MDIYLPIAEISLNMAMLFGIGCAVGFLSGMFGVGGGFLITPLLIFIGVPPAVAVATGSNQVIAASVSGALAHWRRKSIDFGLGIVLLIGGVGGSMAGVWLFKILRESGQVDIVVGLAYTAFLGVIGVLMLNESVRAIRRSRKGALPAFRRPGQHNWIHGLPGKVRFKRSRLYISVVPVLLVGASVGVLAAIMGVGGGFIMVPAMIYLLRVPTNVVIGTSLFQIIFVTAITTVLHAAANGTVDVVLAFILMVGGVIGAQFGAQAGQRLKAEQMRALLAILVLIVCARVLFELVAQPDDVYTLQVIGS
ncbi:MAG: sulfite exporter TauE/SafE family protein [Flavobacteriaceae bacterium]